MPPVLVQQMTANTEAPAETAIPLAREAETTPAGRVGRGPNRARKWSLLRPPPSSHAQTWSFLRRPPSSQWNTRFRELKPLHLTTHHKQSEGAQQEGLAQIETMPRATLSELFGFLQCQLLNEFEVCLNRTDAKRKKIKPVMWDDYEAFVIPNVSREKWVPYHTDLGSHEAFPMTYVHSKVITEWTEKQRFLAIFVFRAHCRK